MFSDDGKSGDHAAKFETSLMLALYPEMVDMERLDKDISKPNIGVFGDEDPRTGASSEFGNQILAKFEKLTGEYFKKNGLIP